MRTALFALCLLSVATYAERLPWEHFGHLPMIEQPSVSPGGAFIAAIINGENGPTVNVAPFGTDELTPILQLKYGRDRIDWIEWVTDERLLIAASESTIVNGDRLRVSRLYSVGRDGKNLEAIVRKTSGYVPEWTYYFDTSRVVSFLRDDPRHILLQLYDVRDKNFAVFKVDVEKNRFEKLFVNSYDVTNWYANSAGDVVLGLSRDKDLIRFWHRPTPDADWEVLHERRSYESETFAPLYIEGDDAIVLSDHELQRESLWRYDIASGEFKELMFAAEGLDIANVLTAPHSDKIVGVSYFDDYRIDHYFDAVQAGEAELVKKSFSQYETTIVSRSRDGKRMVVLASRDTSPDKYFWLDLEARTGGIWFSQYPYLENAQLAPVEPFEFETADGMLLNGYLTMPPEPAAEKPPLIVHPHGGPQSRDYRYFDPYVQFLANRGYAVLQVNFRGSTGFGSAYETAGYREWGQAMQDDVYAAIDWLAARNTVDTERTCFVGASFGGYVALVAAFQRPTAYRCHVALAPVSDLRAQAEASFRWDAFKPYVTRTIGDPTDGADKVMLDANSPIRHILAMKSPLFIVHGTYDTQVRVQQSRDFVKAAERAGVEVEYLEFKSGTHYFDEYASRLELFSALDAFLSEHL